MDDFAPIPVEEPVDAGEQIYRALVVGIDRYDDSAFNMQFCSEPAARLAELLRSRGYLVRELHDHPGSHGRPTLAAVERELDEMVRVSDTNDTVLFYFGGHGTQVDDRPVLLMADARPRGDDFTKGSLTVGRLLTRLHGEARFTVVLLDACRMGLTLDPAASQSTLRVREKAGGFALLSGSTSDDVTQDAVSDEGEGGAFTLALIDGISGRAADENGGVRFSALARHVQDWIETWKRGEDGRKIGARQKPVLRLEVADVQLVTPHNDLRDLTPPTGRRITHAQYSYDGRCLATAAENRKLHVWDARTFTRIVDGIDHDSDIVAINFSSTSTEVTSVTRAGVATMFVAREGVDWQVERMGKRAPVNTVIWSPDRRTRTMATADGIYVDTCDGVVTSSTKKLGRKHGHYLALAYTSEMELCSGDNHGRVCVWDKTRGVPAIELPHEGPVTLLSASSRFRWLAAAGPSFQPRIWNLDTGEATPLPGHRGPVTALAFTYDGVWVATGSQDGTVRLFDAQDGALAKTLTIGPLGGHTPPAVSAICFTGYGESLFAGYSDGRGRQFRL